MREMKEKGAHPPESYLFQGAPGPGESGVAWQGGGKGPELILARVLFAPVPSARTPVLPGRAMSAHGLHMLTQRQPEKGA